MKMFHKRMDGISLVVLVITIIVSIILAGVIIVSTIGNNGIIGKAQDAVSKNKLVSAEEKLQLILNDYILEKSETGTDLGTYLNLKKDEGVIDNFIDNGDGTYSIEIDGYIITTENDKIISVSESGVSEDGPSPQVSDIKVASNPDGTGTELGINTQEAGTPLYINFTHSIEGGTTTVSPSLPYQVTANGKVEFTITGKIGGSTYIKKIDVIVNKYINSLSVGTYIRYNVSYKDMYSNYDFTANDGWRILDPGIENGDGTYSNMKLISTGIPAGLFYNSSDVATATWAGEGENNNTKAANGLLNNFDKIVFSYGTTTSTTNGGYYKSVNGKTSGDLTSTEFLADGATGVHNLTLAELNEARGAAATATTRILASTDVAPGLFYLRGLASNFNYSTSVSPYYWLATVTASNVEQIFYVTNEARFATHNSTSLGVRPVVSLPDNVTINIVSN